MADPPPDVDPTSIPAVMPRSVALVDATGKPLQAFLNWFQALNSWFARTAVNLQTRINTLEDTTGDNTARVSDLEFAFTTSDSAYAGRLNTAYAKTATAAATLEDLEFAVSTNDSAYAGRINTATAQAAGGTANGQVYLVAQAAPSGWTAAYGVELTAGSLQAGMQILVDTATSTSAIMFTASQFMLVDPAYLGGAPQTVFNYTGGVFRFLVPVLVGNQEIEDNAVTNSDAHSGASPQSVTLDIRGAASRICITGTFDGSPSIGFGFPTTNILRLRIKDTGGGTVKDVPVVTTVTNVSGTNYANYYPTPIIYYADGLSAGTYTYTIELYASTGAIPLGLTTDCSIIGIELSR